MPSPFPGMDPYLEGSIWPDVHQALAGEIRNRLVPVIRPQYYARLAVRTVREAIPPEEVSIFYPEVEIIRRRLRETSVTMAGPAAVAEAPTITQPITVPLVEVTMRMVTVEIYTVEDKELVTCIEVLSPANKRGEGLEHYLHKRQRLHRAGVHLLEIDFTRRGRRPLVVAGGFEPAQIQAAPYLISLWRAHASALELWPVQLAEKLPVVAVPLRKPDADVPLDLGAILAAIYDLAGYDLSIDYSEEPPPPPFDENTIRWMQDLLAPYRQPATEHDKL